MKRKIVISALLNQVQVGIAENNRLVEYYMEHSPHERLEGNVYKGRVVNILPGMDAAFLDIGKGRNAFLFLPDLPDRKTRRRLRIGDSLAVQVTKEGDSLKGPRVTTDIGLPGRYLVLMPFQDQTGISRRIVEEEERQRLKDIAEAICPAKMGLIVRTAAQDCSKQKLQEDLDDLLREWTRIKRKLRKNPPQSLLYRDHDLIHRILRDEFVLTKTEIIVDQEELQEQAEKELRDLGVEGPYPVRLYRGQENLFEYLGLQKDLERACQNRVWLDCGGYLIFNQTEALLSIDVNTGKHVGKRDFQQTVLKTNLEAAQEVAYQLRLRNIGGIIIIDFIDMFREENRKAVLEQLAISLKADKTRTRLLGFTSLGLVELTRKRTKTRLSQMLQAECPYCAGTGRIIATETLALQIAGRVRSLALETETEALLVRCHSDVAAQIIGIEGGNLEALEQETGKTIFIKGDGRADHRFYEISSGSLQKLREQAYPVKVGERLQLTIEEPHARPGDSGVARINGFIIECLRCKPLVGQTVEVEIAEVHKTSAVARLVKEIS